MRHIYFKLRLFSLEKSIYIFLNKTFLYFVFKKSFFHFIMVLEMKKYTYRIKNMSSTVLC